MDEKLQQEVQLITDSLGRMVQERLKETGDHLHFCLIIAKPLGRGKSATGLSSDILDHTRIAYVLNDVAVGLWMKEGVMEILGDDDEQEAH